MALDLWEVMYECRKRVDDDQGTPVYVQGNGLHPVIGVTHAHRADGQRILVLLVEDPLSVTAIRETAITWE